MEKRLDKLLGLSVYLPIGGEKLYYYKCISEAQGYIHRQIPKEPGNRLTISVPLDFREEKFQGRNQGRVVMYLLSNGCEWALKEGNGCTMCGHLAKQGGGNEKVSAEELYNHFISRFRTIDFKSYPLLNLYNNGSFLNDNEIPAAAMKQILTAIGRHPEIKMLVLESRPEFVSREIVQEIKTLVPHKPVEIAIGLEIKDDFLRTLCINKGFSLSKYNQAAKMITLYLHLRTYVLLKPLFLTEKEAVDCAIETVAHAFAMGSATVSLEACTIQDYTLVRYLADKGFYHTPWLWSILEVVKSTAHLGKLVIGLFQFFPSPKVVPFNCHRCSHEVMERIRRYNRTLDTSVFKSLTCQCKREWEKEMQKEPLPFDQRVEDILHRLEIGKNEDKAGLK